MSRRILLVDDDRRLLADLKEGLAPYAAYFTVELAHDGAEALERLRRLDIALIVTDLKMPGVDGFALLTEVRERFPDIPVIIITGYSSPDLERLARRSGAVGFIGKPFRPEALAAMVQARLRQQTDGGLLHNMSTGVFLQLIEAEQKTCTLRVVDKATRRAGALFFRDGELLDARCGSLAGEEAALEIFSWGDVSLAIQNDCALSAKRMRQELPALLLEAARRTDESQAEASGARHGLGRTVGSSGGGAGPAGEGGLEALRRELELSLGAAGGVEAVRFEPSWDDRLASLSAAGAALGLGKLCAAYIGEEGHRGKALLPGRPAAVIAVGPKCPRDRLMRWLTQRRGEDECGRR